MNKTELLALAERLDDAPGVLGMLSRADLAEAASILRKLAALEPVAWAFDSRFVDTAWTRAVSDARVREGHYCRNVQALYNLTGIIDHE